MIEMIRANLKSKIAKTILWLTLFSLAGASFASMLQYSRRRRADSIGTVNGEDIGFMEYRRKLAQIQQMMQEIRKRSGPHADMVLKMWGYDKNPQELALEGLIGEKAMQSAANSIGSHVSKEYMHSKLRDPYFVREFLGTLVPDIAVTKNGIDTVALKYNLDRQGITEDAFEEALDEAMKRVLFQRLVEGGLYVSASQLKNIYATEFLKRKVSLLSLSFEEYLKRVQAQKATDGAIEKYFEGHKEEYRIPEKRSAKLYTFDADGYGITIPEKDVESAYHKRKQAAYVEKPESRDILHIVFPFTEANKVEVRAAAQTIFNEVKAHPETFEKVAAEKTKAKDKAIKATVKKNSADKRLEKEVFNLEVNDISPVIETNEGFEIIKLVGKNPAVYKPLDKVKTELLSSLKNEKLRSDFSTNAARIMSQAAEAPELFGKFISEHKGQQSSLDQITRSEKQQATKLFGLSKAGDRAFYVEGDKGYIIELTAITPSTLQPLAAVRDKVVQAYYKDQATKALEADLAAAKERVAKGESLDAVAKSFKGSVENTDWLDPRNRETLKKIQEQGIPVDKVMRLVKVHDTDTVVTPKNGYLIELRELEPFNEADFEKKRAGLEYEVRKQEESSFVPVFVLELRNKAKVQLNDEFARQVGRR